MTRPVVHFEIMGRDGEALRRFYSELFGWEYDLSAPMDYGAVAPADGGIGGGIGSMPEGHPGHVTFYVDVPDVEEVLAQAVSLGGTRLMGPEEILPGMTLGMFQDPEGNLIGVLHGRPS